MTTPMSAFELVAFPVNGLLLEMESNTIPCPKLLSQVLLIKELVPEEVSQIPAT